MGVGDIVFEKFGPFLVDDKDGRMEAMMEAENTGAATAGADTTTFQFVVSEGQTFIYKYFRGQS